MIGRTNALVRALVSSVNGMSGVVVLNANIAYDPAETYEDNTIGKELQDMVQDTITDEQIDAMYGEIIQQTLDDSSEEEPEAAGDEEETAEEPTEETAEEPEETVPEEATEGTNEEEESP